MKENSNTNRNAGRQAYFLSLFTIGLFFVNVLVSKAKVALGWEVWSLGNVGEFLLLFLGVVFLTTAAMKKETAANKNDFTEKEKIDE